MGGDDVFGAVEVAGDRVRAVVRPEHARRLCAGHFPGDPLVPGAHLAALMASVAARIVRDAELVEVERCVFRRRVRPDVPIVVTAERAGRDAARAEVRAADVVAARAVLRFA